VGVEIARIDLHQIGSVEEGNDHLQLIKYWLSCAPGKGSVAEENFGSALLQPARSVCVSLGAFFHSSNAAKGASPTIDQCVKRHVAPPTASLATFPYFYLYL